MKGLIYKDIAIFFKCIDRKMILIAVGAIILLMCNTGVYAGLVASVLLAMTIGMQNVMSFASDEKAGWNQYQMALPVRAVYVVASRYLAVVCTLAVSLAGSVILNLISSVVFRHFDSRVWGVSAAVSVMDGDLSAADVLVWFSLRADDGDDRGDSDVLFCPVF